MPHLSAIAAFGIWPALPLTGYWLLTRVFRKSGAATFPLVTSIALMCIAGIAVWSVPMLVTAILGVYRAEYFGLLGWGIMLIELKALLKRLKMVLNLGLDLNAWNWVLAVGLIVAAWFYLTFPHESMYGGRDEGVYANHGMFISHHGRLDVPYPWPESSDSIFSQSFKGYPGFALTRPTMTVQFSHLLPIWLAQAFSVFGHYGLFRLNSIFALLFIAIFYGTCRLAVPRSYAVVATLFLALNPSQVWLARSSLSEIFSQLFIWSGLLLLLSGLRTGNDILTRCAGTLLGFSALVRIDSLLLVPLLFLSHLAHKIVKGQDSENPSSIWGCFYVTALPVFALAVGWYAFFSAPYFNALSPLLMKIGVATVIALLVLLAASSEVLRTVRPWMSGKPVLAATGLALLSVTVYSYWIRPGGLLPSITGQPGALLLYNREYGQYSMVNLGRYLSPLVILTAILGWYASIWELLRKRQSPHLIPALVLIAGFSTLYLWDPRVSPDHFWAIRRFVPVVIPGFVFCAAIGICWILGRLSERLTIPLSQFIVVFLAVFTIGADSMILLFAENKGYFSQLRQLAERLPKDEVVLADRGTAWATPLYIAFDRKVTPIDWEREKGNNTFNGWIAKQIGEQKPVYLLREARLRLLGLQKIKADEVILSRTYSERTLEPLPKKIVSEQKTIRLYKITGVIKRSDYRNIALGAEMVWGVEESGFHDQEWRDNRPVRWTNGAARLVVPLDEQRAPGALRVDLESTGPKGTTLQVRVNGNTLLNGEIPSGGWSRTFRLPSLSMEGPMTIELLSGTFVPRQAVQGSLDQRTLGVAVQGIRLLEGVQPLPARLLSNEGYRSQLSLAENRENFHVAPGQTIPLKVIVRNIGKDAWPTFADLGVQKGTVNLGILWFARGQVDKRLAEQRSELPHRVFSNDEVEIDVILNPVDYNGRRLPPGIYEAWIELVQEHVAWFHDKGGAVLKLTVEVKS